MTYVLSIYTNIGHYKQYVRSLWSYIGHTNTAAHTRPIRFLRWTPAQKPGSMPWTQASEVSTVSTALQRTQSRIQDAMVSCVSTASVFAFASRYRGLCAAAARCAFARKS